MPRWTLSLLALAPLAFGAQPADEDPPLLWQERYFFDALLTARDRLARSQSDPLMIPVLKSIAQQTAQQVANLEQIGEYIKSQQENLQYAFSEEKPAQSLETIQANFETLAQGADQIRTNLYYLTARCRIASSQALPDSEMHQSTLLILGQIEELQLKLNQVYLDTVALRDQVHQNNWATNKYFKQWTDMLTRSVVRVQDSVFSIYNSAYELSLRSR
ncbi:MAG: hypothetical protein HY549_04865 [Elusimicrobia bacterium]|nr:hypothetical protein [Elusimicrobiota bacterium]